MWTGAKVGGLSWREGKERAVTLHEEHLLLPEALRQ